MILNLNMKAPPPKKSLDDKTREYIINPTWKHFMSKCKIMLIIMGESDKFDHITMNSFYSSKDSINRRKRRTTEENIFATQITDKRLISKRNS